MNAIIKQVRLEDKIGSNLEWGIILEVGEENFGPIWKCLFLNEIKPKWGI